MSELSVTPTQAHPDSVRNRRNAIAYVTVIAAAVVALSCIAVCTAIVFVLIDKIPWHHLWEHLLQSALTLRIGA